MGLGTHCSEWPVYYYMVEQKTTQHLTTMMPGSKPAGNQCGISHGAIHPNISKRGSTDIWY